MAVILKIRNKMGIFIVVVIAIAILGFLLMDMINSDSSVLMGDRNLIGEVNGQEISQMQYFSKVDEVIQIQKQRSNQTSVSDEMVFNIRNQTWNDMVVDILLQNEYDELALNIMDEEFSDMVYGPNPDPMIRQQFVNSETKQFDRKMLTSTLDQILNNPERQQEYQAWLQFEEVMKKEKLKRKLRSLIKNGYHFPNWLAETDFTDKNRRANIKYIMIATDNPDTSAPISDNALEDYLDRNEGKYKQEANRTIDFVSFDVIPSFEDTMEIYNWEKDQMESFKNSKDDSMFVILNSDDGFNDAYLTVSEMEGTLKDTFFSVDTGTLIGPYEENGYFKLAKVVDRKLIPDSVRYRKILVRVNSAEEVLEKREKVDSLMKLLENGADFAEVARANSEHEETAIKGGDVGWVYRGREFRTVNSAIFYRKNEGDLFVVPGQEGFMILEIQEAEPVSIGVQVGYISKLITWSESTRDEYYQKAITFANQCDNAENFNKLIEENETLTKRTASNSKINDFRLIGLGVCREIINWAFEADMGEISNELFILEDKFVIALVSEVFEEGRTPLEGIRTETEVNVRKELEAARIKKQMEDAINKSTDLSAIANELNAEVQTATDVAYDNNFIANIGSEPKLVGAIFGLQENNKPFIVVGENGVFIVVIQAFNVQEPNLTISQQVDQMLQAYKNKVDRDIFKILKNSADVVDKRYLFY